MIPRHQHHSGMHIHSTSLTNGSSRWWNWFYITQQQISYAIKCKMFVDDNTTSTKKFINWIHTKPDPIDIGKLLQFDTQTWEQYLWTSRGLLNLNKWLYYIMAWEFDPKGFDTLIPTTRLPEIKLSSGDSNIWKKIKHFDCSKVHKSLGKNGTIKTNEISTEWSTNLSESLCY